jgi:ABC-type sugar transport system substrate-binding protein
MDTEASSGSYAMRVRRVSKSFPAVPARRAVREGRLAATVFQDARAQGRSAEETAVRIVRGERSEKPVWVSFRRVTRENVDPYRR